MNFNLISPDGNGHNYNVRYNDPITIPPNSTVSLNWAQFERGSSITFTEDQFFTYEFDNLTPNFKLVENTTNGKNNSSNLTFKIKRGTYTCEELLDEIAKVQAGSGDTKIFCGFNQFNREITTVPEGILNPESTDILLNKYEYIIPRQVNNGHSLVIGINKHVDRKNILQTIETKNGRSGYFANADGWIVTGEIAKIDNVYMSTNGSATNKIYNNNSFAITREKYFHIGRDMDTFNTVNPNNNTRINNGILDEFRGANIVTFKLTKSPERLNGSVFVGFVCEENSGIRFGTHANFNQRNSTEDANKFHQDNACKYENYYVTDPQDPTNLITEAFPQSLGGISFDSDGIVVVGHYYRSVTGCITDAAGHGGKMLLTKSYAELGLNLINQTNPMFGFQIYRPNSAVLSTEGTTEDPLDAFYVRCFYIGDSGNPVIFFDSDYLDAKEDWVFNKAFQNEFKLTAASHDTEAKRRSQLPFNIIMSATSVDEGVKQIVMDEILSGGGGDSRLTGGTQVDTYVSDTMVERYSIKATKQLARLIVNNNAETSKLSPRYPSQTSRAIVEALVGNALDSVPNSTIDAFYQINQIIAQYRLDRFTVYCNQLPIKVYQNTGNKSKSGNRRNILSNIPNPFSGANIFDEGEGDIIGSYVPSLGINNFLGNQMMTTNNFEITIRNMDDDTPAEQLTKSVINFTITPPGQ